MALYGPAQLDVRSEFEVNTYTTNDQKRPAVATDAFGNFLVVWETREVPAMRRLAPTISLFVLFLLGAAHAQVPDHLKCYKVRDLQWTTSYTADLDGLAVDAGCTIRVPAVLACVPSTKTNVSPSPPGAGGAGTPNSFGCYKIKCPSASLPTLSLSDQFGSRTVTPIKAKLLCAPST